MLHGRLTAEPEDECCNWWAYRFKYRHRAKYDRCNRCGMVWKQIGRGLDQSESAGSNQQANGHEPGNAWKPFQTVCNLTPDRTNQQQYPEHHDRRGFDWKNG